MQLTIRHASFCIMLLSACAMGCGGRERCGVPAGVGMACQCSNGAAGVRVCQPDLMWGPCDCTGRIELPGPVQDMGPNASSGGAVQSGAMPAGGGGAVQSGGMQGDEDSGMDPTQGPDASSSTGGVISTGGGLATGGTMDAGAGLPPYRACAAASDCDSGGQCMVTASFPTNASVCAPACVDVGDCPVPDGSYEASVICDVGFCRLDCTPVLFAALLTCPADMTCIAPLLGTAYCHANAQ